VESAFVDYDSVKWSKQGVCLSHIVMVVEGETRLILLQNDEATSHLMLQSTLMIVPQNVWHRFESPKGVKILTITPQPTDHSIKRPK